MPPEHFSYDSRVHTSVCNHSLYLESLQPMDYDPCGGQMKHNNPKFELTLFISVRASEYDTRVIVET